MPRPSGVRWVVSESEMVGATMLYFSQDSDIEDFAGIRPVVTLNPEIQITGGNGTSGWEIE